MSDEEIRRRDDELALQIALFRYGVIAPAVEPEALPPGERSARVRAIAAAPHYRPGAGSVRVAERTVYAWMRSYRAEGIEGLLPAVRKDRGTRRALSDRVLARAIALREEVPGRWTSTLIDILEREGTLRGERPFHRATLDRHLDRLGKSRRALHIRASPRTTKLEVEGFGTLWVGDYHHGPTILRPDGTTATAKLGAFIDHATRYPVADRYYPAENLASLRDTLMRALLVWGIPRRVYVDRGKVYLAEQLRFSLKLLESDLVHSRPYYSQGRGVIERWWQLAQAFEQEVEARESLLSLEELNRLWVAYREERYCHQVHSDLGRTPAEAVAEVAPEPVDPEIARRLFRVRADRTVHRKDACVVVLGHRFQCDSVLRGRRLQVRYDPNDLRSVEIYRDRKHLQTAFPQRTNAPEKAPAPTHTPTTVDYLELIRRDYDRRLAAEARPLAFVELEAEERFDLAAFFTVVQDLADLTYTDTHRRELTAFWETFGPLPEALVRVALEHAIRTHGRRRHPRVYLHAIRNLVLAEWRAPLQEDSP